MTSRVVPGTSVTIARSAPSNRLSTLDLPALGFPTIAARAPSRARRPRLKLSCNSAMSSAKRLISAAISLRPGRFSPSSAKSISASRWARIAITALRKCSTCCAKAPLSCAKACCSALSLRTSIRSATASASVRSIRPLRKARRLNSPRSATLAPAAIASPTTRRTIYGPP